MSTPPARRAAAALALALLAAAAPARGQEAEPAASADSVPARLDRGRLYLRAVAGPAALARAAGMGTFDHLRTDPDEWGGGADALGKRVSARWGSLAVEETTEHALAARLDRVPDPRYEPCTCRETGWRLAHALLSPLSDRTDRGARFATPRVAGAYAGGLANMALYPDEDLRDALLSGTISLAMEGAFNVLREFTGL